MNWIPWKSITPSRVHLRGRRARVWTKTGGHCGYCGCPLDPRAFHVDHVVPRRLGGTDDLSNLLACCIHDNLTKGSLTLEEFRTLVERRSGRRSGRFSSVWRRRHKFYFERKGIQLDEID